MATPENMADTAAGLADTSTSNHQEGAIEVDCAARTHHKRLHYRTILDLPNELIDMVIDLLEIYETASLTLTCHSLYKSIGPPHWILSCSSKSDFKRKCRKHNAAVTTIPFGKAQDDYELSKHDWRFVTSRSTPASLDTSKNRLGDAARIPTHRFWDLKPRWLEILRRDHPEIMYCGLCHLFHDDTFDDVRLAAKRYRRPLCTITRMPLIEGPDYRLTPRHIQSAMRQVSGRPGTQVDMKALNREFGQITDMPYVPVAVELIPTSEEKVYLHKEYRVPISEIKVALVSARKDPKVCYSASSPFISVCPHVTLGNTVDPRERRFRDSKLSTIQQYSCHFNTSQFHSCEYGSCVVDYASIIHPQIIRTLERGWHCRSLGKEFHNSPSNLGLSKRCHHCCTAYTVQWRSDWRTLNVSVWSDLGQPLEPQDEYWKAYLSHQVLSSNLRTSLRKGFQWQTQTRRPAPQELAPPSIERLRRWSRVEQYADRSGQGVKNVDITVWHDPWQCQRRSCYLIDHNELRKFWDGGVSLTYEAPGNWKAGDLMKEHEPEAYPPNPPAPRSMRGGLIVISDAR